ncbi:MAG: cell division protein ZapD, partial [Candidatus Competibacterales bacterium]|nr:cell division protein ZapD [Candidatus Competibacterales bacterium]
MAASIRFEFPLNERTRQLLRLDHLFRQFEHSLNGTTPWDTRAALLVLFDLVDLSHRGELRSELGKALNHQLKAFRALQAHDDINPTALEQVLTDLDSATEALQAVHVSELDVVGQVTFLHAVRQRSGIPGGNCPFDLPGLHHWLQRTTGEERRAQLRTWTEPLLPLRDGSRLLLELLRGSAPARSRRTEKGLYQQTLETRAALQLIVVEVDAADGLFPEVSGGQHRFAVRFLTQPELEQPARPADQDTDFRLACCVI